MSIEGSITTSDRQRDRAVLQSFAGGAGAKIAGILFNLVAIGLATRYLGPDGFGVLTVIIGLSALFGFLDFGIGQSLIAPMAAAAARNDTETKNRIFANSSSALVLIGAAIVVVGVPLVFLISPQVYLPVSGANADSAQMGMLSYVLLVGASMITNIAPRIAIAFQHGLATSVATFAASIMSITFVSIGIAFSLPFAFFVVAFLAPIPISNLGLLFFIISDKRYGLRLDLRLTRWRGMWAILVAGFPFFTLTLAASIAYQVGIVVVGLVLGAASAAVFGIVTRMFQSLTTLFAAGLQQVWGSVAHAAAEGNSSWIRRRFLGVFATTSSLYLLASCAVIFLGPLVIPLWVGPEYHIGWRSLVSFAAWNTYAFMMSIISMLLNGLGIIWRQALPGLLMAGALTALSILLTPHFGIDGPQYASLIAHVCTSGWVVIWLAIRALRSMKTWTVH